MHPCFCDRGKLEYPPRTHTDNNTQTPHRTTPAGHWCSGAVVSAAVSVLYKASCLLQRANKDGNRMVELCAKVHVLVLPLISFLFAFWLLCVYDIITLRR